MKYPLIAKLTLLVILLASFPMLHTNGQTEAESNYNLLLEHQDNAKQNATYTEGVEVKVQTLDGSIFEGQLNGVKENSLVIGANEIEFSRIKMLDVKGKDKDGNRKIGGLILLIFGGVLAVIGTVYSFIARRNNRSGNDPYGCGTFAAVLVAILMFTLALGLLIPGLVLMLTVSIIAGTKFEIGDKWKVKSVEK